jgi:imidazolonepropionase-like amidohydrolase
LTPPGGHCRFLGGEVDGPDDIRDLVARNADAGADLIKVMVSGGSLTPGGAGMWEPQFSTDQLKLVVAQVHRHRLPVAAHAHGSIRACVDAGVDTIERCTWLTGPRCFRNNKQLRTCLVGS